MSFLRKVAILWISNLDMQSQLASSLPPSQISILNRLLPVKQKGSFASTASSHGDSVGSNGRLGGPTVCEPNSANNLLLFDGENEIFNKDSLHPSRRNNIVPS